jgi:hypothetical protein
MELELQKSGYKLKLMDEITGEISIQLEKASKSSLNLDQEIEKTKNGFRPGKVQTGKTTMTFSKDKKVLMEFAHLMILEAKDKSGNLLTVDDQFVRNLVLSDFNQLKKEIENLTLDVDFF